MADSIITYKTCPTCKIKKTVTEFYLHRRWRKSSTKSELRIFPSTHCKECTKAKSRAYMQTPEQKERALERSRTRRLDPDYQEKERIYRHINKNRIAKKSRKWYVEVGRERLGFNPRREKQLLSHEEQMRRQRNSTLKSKYGICHDEYEQMFKAQNGVCAICGQPPIGKAKNLMLAVDHCHKTGKVRGLLCHKHNSAIGLLGDNVELVRKALEYLLTNG